MKKEIYVSAQLQLVGFDNEDIIATSVETDPSTFLPTETDPVMPSMGPNDTEIL